MVVYRHESCGVADCNRAAVDTSRYCVIHRRWSYRVRYPVQRFLWAAYKVLRAPYKTMRSALEVVFATRPQQNSERTPSPSRERSLKRPLPDTEIDRQSSAHYDVFISVKNVDPDEALARTLHDYLRSKGLNVFLSCFSLEQRGDPEYAQAINRALDAAQVLVAVGTSKDHLESKWVSYEWRSFWNDMMSEIKPKGRVFAYVDKIEPISLPRELRQYEVICHEEGALERPYNFIVNAMFKDPMQKPDRKGEKGGPCPECGSPTVAHEQKGTGKLYFGCTNFAGGCRFNGCRDHLDNPATRS